MVLNVVSTGEQLTISTVSAGKQKYSMTVGFDKRYGYVVR